jgi:hypothetical protein
MSFTAISSGEIASGEPVAYTTQTKIKDNFDDHETRLLAIEAGSFSYAPIILRMNGVYDVVDSILKTTINFDLTITGARLLIDEAGTSGTTEIDIQVKSGVGAYASIFSTQPTSVYTDGDDFLSTDGVLDPTKVELVAGDIIRLDITSAQVAGSGFLVRIDYERTGA